MAGGTYNRYLPLYVERSRRLPIPEGVSDDDRVALGARLAAAIDRPRRCARSARTRSHRAVDRRAVRGADRRRRRGPRRSRVHPPRRAVLPARRRPAGRARRPPAHRQDDLTAAAALVRYSIASARYVLDRQARDPRLDRIRRAVDAAGDAGLSRSAVSGLFSRNLTKEVLDELLAELTADGDYEIARQATRAGLRKRTAEFFLLLSYLGLTSDRLRRRRAAGRRRARRRPAPRAEDAAETCRGRAVHALTETSTIDGARRALAGFATEQVQADALELLHRLAAELAKDVPA